MSDENELRELINILDKFHIVKFAEFNKDDTIADFLEKRDRVFILTNGSANLIKYDTNGNTYILQHYHTNDLFGEAFHQINVSGEYVTVAAENCSVASFSLSQCIEKLCGNTTNSRPFLLLFKNFKEKFEALNYHIEMLSQRNLRNRLLAYFESLARQNYQRVFYIPMNYTQLADYLSVDRSAMMREIKALEDEGFIDRHKYRIRLLTNQ